MIKVIPKKQKCEKAKWLSEEALQIAEKRRETKGKRGKKSEFEFKKITGKDKKNRRKKGDNGQKKLLGLILWQEYDKEGKI